MNARHAPHPRSALVFTLLLGVFFLSGASGLMYQVVWTRLLALVFGVTIYAISAVLASFMAGLALGSFAAGRVADRVERPLLWYAVAEIVIGGCGIASLAAINALSPLYLWLYSATEGSLALVSVARFLAAGTLLLIPTSLMGATLPFVVKASLLLLPKVGENVSLLYAMNTAGAAAGTLAAGFVLIGQFGLQTTVTIAAAFNVAAGIAALALEAAYRPAHKRAPLPPQESVDDASGARYTAASVAVIAGMGVSGFCALAYEVIWFRILDLFLNGTVYAFSIMLFTFLVGLAAGSALTRFFIGRRWNWVAVLGVLQSLVCLEALLSIYAVGLAPLARDGLMTQSATVPWLARPVAGMVLVSVLVLLPLTILQGMTFPVAAAALAEGRRRAGAVIGELNAANTLGAILGSLIAGFVLVPVLGSHNSLVLLASCNMAVALTLLWLGLAQQPRLRLALPGLALVLALPLLAPNLTEAVLQRLFKGHQLVWYEEGLENTVSVQKHPRGYAIMYINSREQAFDLPAMASFHQFLGHLPMLVHPKPKDALVIGLGGGATPGAISHYPDAQVDIVELSPSVVRAASFFSAINNDVIRQPNVRMVVDDGRNHLLLARKKYDVITADLIRAHHAGAGNLYSRAYFELAMNALKDDGIMAQWVDPEQPALQALIIRTYLSVFPHVTFWDGGMVLIGSKHPLDLRPETLQRRLDQPSAREGARVVGAHAADVLRHYTDDGTAFRELIGDGPILTDDRPLTEYFRSVPNGPR